MMFDSHGGFVDSGTAFGVLGSLLSLALGAWVATLRIAIGNREKELDRRIDEVRTKATAIDERLHVEEKSTIRQDGALELVRQAQSGIFEDIREIKSGMATKTEMERCIRALEALQSNRRFTPGAATYASQEPLRAGRGSRHDPER